ncbi:MAG TPA: hypothetical protein VN538_09000 [Clostridia bacterium]|nr:hypothetical protein [Clostridia bacterium]
MEQPIQVKCFLCEDTAEFVFAYARFSERETFQGVIYRGVCADCLRAYIENIKKDRHLRGELLLWPVVFLPIGALLAAFSRNVTGMIIGDIFLGLALVVPLLMRLWQRRDAIRAIHATEQENFTRYSEPMCREDALRTSKQTKLIYLRPEYAAPGADAGGIVREIGVSPETAQLLQKLSAAAQNLLRGQARAGGFPTGFDKPEAL